VNAFWICFGAPTPQLGKLLVAQTLVAVVLSLDAHEKFGNVFLPLRLPSQDAIENRFHLILGHQKIIAHASRKMHLCS
jgi:hypothetical protein